MSRSGAWRRWVGAISGQIAVLKNLHVCKTLLFCYIGKPDRKRAAQNRKKRVAQQAPKTRKTQKSKGTEKKILKTIGFCYTRQTKNPKTPKSKKTGAETQATKQRKKTKSNEGGRKPSKREKTSFKVLGICYTAKTRKTNLHKPGLNPKTPKTTKDKERKQKTSKNHTLRSGFEDHPARDREKTAKARNHQQEGQRRFQLPTGRPSNETKQ